MGGRLAANLRRPEDLAHHTLLHATVSRDDWAALAHSAGPPVSLALRLTMLALEDAPKEGEPDEERDLKESWTPRFRR
jgi:hypothetical protein